MRYFYNVICLIIIGLSLFLPRNAVAEAPQIRMYQEAMIYYDNELYTKALELVDNALKLNPYYTDCYNLKGLIYFKTNNPDSAEFFLKKSLELDKFYTKSIYDLSLLYFSRNYYDSALAQINTALSIDTSNIDYRTLAMEILLHLNSFNEFIKHFEFLEKLAPNYSITKFLYGKYLEKIKNYDEAKKYYNSALNTDYSPFIPQPYLALGNLMIIENNFDEAIEFYEQALKYKETSATAKIKLAQLYHHTNNYDKVIRLWDITPSYYLNVYHIGMAYYKKALDVLNENNANAAKNLITQAFNYLETALNMYYDDELTRFMIEKILLRIEAVNSPIRQKYSDFNNYLGLQFFYDYSKHLNALFSMQRAIRLDPQNINKRYELAKMYQRLNNVPAAIDEYNKILDIDNRNINAKDYRDLLKYDFDNKSELLKKYINQNATNKRLKILIKLQSDFSNILHSNFFEILEEYLINLSEYNFKFDFYFAPRHLETLDLIEQFAKSINADGIINISLEQTDDNIKAKAQILNLTDIKDKPNFDIFRGRRSLDLKSAERTLIFSGKNKFLNTAVELYNFLDAFFPIIAKVNEIQKYNIIINVGYYQGLKKDDKIILINRTANEDKRLGDAKILDTVGHYALCELLDAKTANTLKIEDLAIIFK